MFWRLAAIVASLCLIQGILSDDVNPCRRQPFRGRCPSLNGATPMRSQFVLRYYLRGGECVSYPYGHCANDDNEPKLFRYKEECEDACVKQANSPTTVKPKESDSLVVDPSEVVETGTEAPQSSGEFTYATGGVESTTGSYETPKTECQRQRDTRGQGLIKGGFIPECSANGEFKQLQCEQDKSECFCVNAEGIEIDNSRTKAGQEKPDCEKIISASSLQTNECVGGAETGPCRSSIPRFYYDEPTQSCQQFLYSGCGGNGNNYPTQAACEHRCVPPKEAGKCHKGKDPLRTSQGQLVNCAKTECPAGYKCSVIQHSSVCCPDDEKSVVGVLHSGIGAAACELPKERGPCDRYELRFYFNKELNECKYFFYGGCEGNDNNFARVEECEKTCGAKVSGDSPPPQAPFVETKQTQPTTTTTERATTTTARATTQAPTTTTPTTTVPPTTSTAEQTATTTERERPTQPTFHLPRDESIEVRTFPSVTTPELPTDRCLHPRDEGSCGGQFVRWLWNNENRKCESFAYTGCGGNGNNFASMEECLSICHIEVAKPEPLPEVVNVCETAVDAGDCSGTFMRYAFEPSTNDCHQFAYTGCGGNGNNFATISDCRKKCVPQKGPETTEPTTASTALNVSLQITPTKNICDHPIEIGECSGIFHRFAYDGESNECRQFEYGGCGGNGNNFATITECRLACVRTRCPPPPTCDTSRCQVVNDVRGCPFCSCPPPPQHPPIIPNFQPEPQCPPLDVNLCVEPCIIFSNRRGCKECVCPVLPNQLPPQSLPPSRPTQHQAPVPPPPAPDVSMPRSIVKPSPTPPQLPRPTEAPTTQEPIQFVPQQPFVRPPAPQQPQHPAPPRFEPEQTPQPPRFNPQPPAPPAPIRAPSAPAPPAPPAPRFNTNNIIQPVIQGVTNNVDEKPLQLPPQRPRATIADLGEKCTQPVDPGPCKNFVERWHFNEQQGECEPFSYGGCAGNRNHFFSRRECEIHCARFSLEPKRVTRPPTTTLPPQPIPDEENTDDMMVEPQPAPVFTPRPVFRPIPTTGSPPPSVEKVTIFGPPQKPEFDPEACVMPPDAGRCRNFVARWFYNAERGSCQEFSYGSCGGNANNFADKATCEARCVPSVNAVLPQRCNWPKDEGFGNGYHPKWYFNSRNLRCEQMVFRGSGGNDNQFSSQGDCDLSCKPVHGSFVPQPPPRKGHKETDKKQPLPSAHGSITQGGGYDGLPSPVHELPASAPAPAPYAPTANAPAEKQPTAPASGPAPATAPQAPSVNVNQYVPATPPLRPEYNSVEEPRAPAPVAPSAPAPGPTSSVPSQAPASHSSSNSNVGGVESEGYSGQGQGSAPSVPVAPPTHNVAPEETSSSHGQSPNHEAGIGVGRADYEEPTVPGINHEAGIGTQPSKSESNNVETETVDQTGANAPDSNIEGGQSSNNVEESHGSAATDSNTQGSKYESNNENIESGGSATGPETPAAPANTQVHSSGGNSNNNYHAIPAETQMVETPDSHLPMLGLSPKMEIDYQKGERLDNGPKAHGIQTATGEQIFNGNFDDKSIDAIKLINGDKDEGSREELARIPTCPNGLQAKTYTDGRPVMCLPGKDQCPENSVCYFNGLDFFCCPNADDPYDQHIFGGYDGEEVKHGYKSVPTSLNIRALRRKRQAGGIPPSSFSIDHITKPLRFDDKPVKQISRAGSVDALARLRVNPCTEEVQEGSCNEAHLRYFYDIKTDTCRLFYYSGCDGNANNFITQNECNQRCKLGIVITTTEAPVPPGRCPGGKLPLGDNAPVLCGNQTDSIGCPRGYYCRNGPPDVCCPDEIPDLQTILSQNVNREIRRRPFISAAGKFEGGEHHHHEHEHHHAVHGVATEHVAAGYDADSAGVNTGSASQTNEHEHAAESHTPEGHAAEGHVDESHAEQAHAASEASSGASESAGASGTAATTSAPTATTFGLPENICPDGSDALTEKDGKTTKMCGSGFDGHELCPRGFYCSIDPERNSRLCCPMTLQGSNIPQPPVIAPYFGHRRHNPGEVVERGSLPSDPKPPKLVTPKPKTRMTMEDFENMNAGGESTAEFHPPGGSEGVEKGSNYDENDGMPGARPETETGSQLDSKPDKVPIEENPSDANAVAPAQVQPAQMPTDEGEEEKGPYAHLRLKPFIRQGKLQQSRANDSTAIEDDHVHIRTSSQEDPFEVDGESKKVYKEIFDLSMCQLRPSEGRQCREDEPQPLTNLQYFYSIKDRKCKLFFHRGCGGNSNRFDSKADCEKACSSLMGQ